MSPSLRRIGAALGVAGALAMELGVSESKVQAAMEGTRPSGGGRPPQSGQTQGGTS